MAATKPGFRPRDPNLYTNEAYGRGASAAPMDDLCFNPKIGRITVLRPKGKDGPLWFRPSPAIDYLDNTILKPGRNSNEAGGQSHWYCRVDVASYIGAKGCPSKTFILKYPFDEETRDTPYQRLFFTAVAKAKAAKWTNAGGWRADWNCLLPALGGSRNESAALTKPTAKGFVQASAVYINGKKDYTAGDRTSTPLGMSDRDDPIFIELSGAGGDALTKLLDRRRVDKNGDELPLNDEQPWKSFYYGDATGIFDLETRTVKGGLIIGIFNPREYQQITTDTSWDGEVRDIPSYEAALRNAWKSPTTKAVFKADLDEKATRRVLDKWKFWFPADPSDPKCENDGALRVMPIPEQARHVAQAFQTYPALLEFCWQETDYLTKDVLAVLRQRRMAAVPGDPAEYMGETQAAATAKPPVRQPRAHASTAAH